MKEKFLLFTTGGGSSDPLNWSKDEAALYPVSKFNGIRPGSGNTLVLYFEGGSTVTLKIKNGLHIRIMLAIANAIYSSEASVISIADIDSGRLINQDICGVTIS